MKLLIGLFTAALALGPLAHAAEAPIVVEMFTSKYCPSCPAAESKMREIAAEDPSLFIMFAHVDYWDRGNRKDPHGLPEVTQRQYDYSNTLGRRPGEVFTPMPLLDGHVIANAPLWMNWKDALRTAKSAPAKALLDVSKKDDGSLAVNVPATVAVKDSELWLIGVDPVDGAKVWTVKGVTQAQLNDATLTVPAAMVPKGQRVLALLQKAGPGTVLASGLSQ